MRSIAPMIGCTVGIAFAVLSTAVPAGIGDVEGGSPAAVKTTANEGTNPYTGDTQAIAEGEKLWRATGCYSCHGGVAEGGVGPNLTDDVWVYKPTDKTLFRTIVKGRRGTNMVGWSADLDDDQIWKTIAYIRSLYQGNPNKIIW